MLDCAGSAQTSALPPAAKPPTSPRSANSPPAGAVTRSSTSPSVSTATPSAGRSSVASQSVSEDQHQETEDDQEGGRDERKRREDAAVVCDRKGHQPLAGAGPPRIAAPPLGSERGR